jgi:hypothetical protein
VQFHVTTGAVFDTLAQIHLMRGTYERASEYLHQAGEAYGGYGAQTGKWYEWSVKVLEIKLANRRGAFDEAITRTNDSWRTGHPTGRCHPGGLAACEALLELGRVPRPSSGSPRASRASTRARRRPTGGNSCACAARCTRAPGSRRWRITTSAQSVNIFDLLGERLSDGARPPGRGAPGGRDRRACRGGTQPRPRDAGVSDAWRQARSHPTWRRCVRRSTPQPRRAGGRSSSRPTTPSSPVSRMPRSLPDLLARETVTTLQDITGLEIVAAFVAPRGSDPRLLDFRGCDRGEALALARAAADGAADRNGIALLIAPARQGGRWSALLRGHRQGAGHRRAARKFRLLTAVARQGFELCSLRERPAKAAEQQGERTLEPLLPGFICASAAMARVADQIQRVQGQTLTVLITGESGTGKDLIARAIHAGSPRRTAAFLPFNCTTMTRELASSQLFGHRRGSFTGAMTDQPGLIRSAVGGTLFLDEIGDVPLDVQPQLPAVPRAGRDPADRRDASAGGRRARARGHQRRPRSSAWPRGKFREDSTTASA